MFTKAALAAWFLLASHDPGVAADPIPLPPPPPQEPDCKVFCFRITDIRCSRELFNDTSADKTQFHFEFEVINWADVWMGGVELALTELSSPSISFDEGTLLDGIDADGRPIQLEDVNNDGVINAIDNEDTVIFDGIMQAGEDKNLNGRFDNDKIPGNKNRPNDFTLVNVTETNMEWSIGDSGTAVPFINLIDAPDGPCPCVAALPTRGATATAAFVNDDNFIEPPELIDNGDNVQDGFVMTINGFKKIGSRAVMNWYLKGAGDVIRDPRMETTPPAGTCRIPRNGSSGTIPLGSPIGTPDGVGNAMGFGLIDIVRLDDQNHTFSTSVDGQTGVSQSTTGFYDNVFRVPGCGKKGRAAEFALEFSAGLVCNPVGGVNPPGVQPNCRPSPGAGGDPHFTTWTGERFTFHGDCDMVIVRNPKFDNGKGMHIHGRSKLHDDSWAGFESAAVQIGSDTLEVQGSMDYWINGVQHNAPVPGATLGGYRVVVETEARHNSDRRKKHRLLSVQVELGENRGKIIIKPAKNYLFVYIREYHHNDFAGSDGLLGSFETGARLARDGTTTIHDPNEFGQEWQVRSDDEAEADPMLFHVAPPRGKKCKLPGANLKAAERIRRLRGGAAGEDLYTRAKEACMQAVGVTAGSLENCISDVMQTGDFDLVEAY